MKLIYEEPLNIATEALEQPDKPAILEHINLNELKKRIEKVQKREIMLKLKQLFNKHSVRLDRLREWYDIQVLESRVLTDIENLIKELENDIHI